MLTLSFINVFGRSITLQSSKDIRSAIKSSQSGDTLMLEDGDYESPGWLDNIRFDNPVLIKAVNSQKARFVKGNGLNINNCRGLIFDGLEITSLSTNSGLVQIQGQSSYITIRNCHIHNAPTDADCIKVNQSNNINIINCHLHDPGPRAAGNGQQETLDYLDVDTGLISGCFFSGGTSRQYVNAKGLSSFITVENCILKDHNGDQGDAAIILGGWSSSNYFDNSSSGYECENMVVKNNIIINSKTGVFQISNVKNGYIYNNLAINCSGHLNSRGLIYVSPGNGPGSSKGTLHLKIYNNIFVSDSFTKLPSQLMQISSTTLDSFSHGNNLYYFGNRSVPVNGGYNPNKETGAVFQNPNFSNPTGSSYDEILKSLTPILPGPWTDAGNVSAINKPYPSVTTDILSKPRTSEKIDIGPFEFSSSNIKKDRIIRPNSPIDKHKKRSSFLLNGTSLKYLNNKPVSSTMYIMSLKEQSKRQQVIHIK